MDASPAVQNQEREEYPALRSLVRGYFNQDYDEYGKTFDEIVMVVKEESTRRQNDGLRLDIERFLERYGGNEEIVKKAFRRVFTPEIDFDGWNGRSTRDALLKIVEILSDDSIPCWPGT